MIAHAAAVQEQLVVAQAANVSAGTADFLLHAELLAQQRCRIVGWVVEGKHVPDRCAVARPERIGLAKIVALRMHVFLLLAGRPFRLITLLGAPGDPGRTFPIVCGKQSGREPRGVAPR